MFDMKWYTINLSWTIYVNGCNFVDELGDEVPDDNIVILVHGVSKAVQIEAERRGLKVLMQPVHW